MAQLARPPKQGNVTTYVQKVAMGFRRILAGEVDADLDTLYAAWNGGADTANLRDGSVTGDKLAADAVGPRELQDGGVFTVALADGAVTTPKLADGAVTEAKLTSVPWSKLTGAPTGMGPVGAAGGDLAGSYPNPTLRDGAVTAGKLAPGAIGATAIAAGSITGTQIASGTITSAHIVNGTIGATDIAPGAIGATQIAAGAVGRTQLAPGIAQGTAVTVPVTAFNTPIHSQWITVATLPALVTRGPNPVLLFANHGLGMVASGDPGIVHVRWTRNGTQIAMTAYQASGPPFPVSAPVPTVPHCDFVPSAGSYTYQLDVYLQNGIATVFFPPSMTGCGLFALEIG